MFALTLQSFSLRGTRHAGALPSVGQSRPKNIFLLRAETSSSILVPASSTHNADFHCRSKQSLSRNMFRKQLKKKCKEVQKSVNKNFGFSVLCCVVHFSSCSFFFFVVVCFASPIFSLLSLAHDRHQRMHVILINDLLIRRIRSMQSESFVFVQHQQLLVEHFNLFGTQQRHLFVMVGG